MCVCILAAKKIGENLCQNYAKIGCPHTHSMSTYPSMYCTRGLYVCVCVCVCNRCEILDHDGMLHNSVEVDSILYISWNGMEYWLNQNCREKRIKRLYDNNGMKCDKRMRIVCAMYDSIPYNL